MNAESDEKGLVSYDSTFEWSASIFTLLNLPLSLSRAAPRPLPEWNKSSWEASMRMMWRVGELR